MTTFSYSDYVVEPANVHLIKCITSINIANYARTRCTPPDGCPVGTYYYNDDITNRPCLINAQDIKSATELVPGFNCNIYAKDNTFTIEGLKGGGASLIESQCSEIPMNVEETELIAQGQSLDGCVMCDETIKSINGVTGTNINLQGGAGVSVIPGTHEITIALDKQQMSTGCETE